MDLYEIRGGPLGVIAEEAEHQSSRESTAMADRGGRATRGVSTFQRFSVDTNESLRFEPCEESLPSPTGAGDGLDDVFKEGETEVGTHTCLQTMIYEWNTYFSNILFNLCSTSKVSWDLNNFFYRLFMKMVAYI